MDATYITCELTEAKAQVALIREDLANPKTIANVTRRLWEELEFWTNKTANLEAAAKKYAPTA